MSTKKKTPKEAAAVREVVQKPGRDDVHEQREADQSREGTVQNVPPPARPAGAPKRR